ncbi:MAG: TlpA family protein disulfide reductase [SAR202 cluster bacterium]|nr:TlpA family protein disulfide reductase [SAR202 cluster bacterium]
MTKRSWIILGGGVPILALIALLAWASIKSGGNPGGLAVNSDFAEAKVDAKAARDFELELIAGGTLKLSDLRGKIVMVDFWASWCQPCRVEAPVLRKVYQEFQGQPVEFVGVAIWDSIGDAEFFIQQEGVIYPNGFDGDGVIAIDYGVRGIPEKYFIGRDGVVAKKLSGPLTETALRDTINELLNK